VLEEILGSRTKIRILRLLYAHPDREFSTRELARTVGQSLGSVYPSLEQLLATRAILTRRVGRSRTIRANRTHPLSESLAALFQAETASLADVGRAFANALPRQGTEAAILFGSVARGEAAARSDVDVLVVVDDPTRVEAVQEVAASMLDRYDVNVSPLVLTSKEVARRLATFDPLLTTISAEGRRLRGKATWLGR
jgi:uncharacterized protein